MFVVYEEGTASSFRGLCEMISRHGLFCALYEVVPENRTGSFGQGVKVYSTG